MGACELAMASEYLQGRNGDAWNGVVQKCLEDDTQIYIFAVNQSHTSIVHVF